MINSIYTHKEIFLRELISNSSDAIDKLYYRSLVENLNLNRGDFYIRLTLDKDNRQLTISDNGEGMDKGELENNLGTIAKSGSFNFKKENEIREDIEIIGQFGVGFYSSFMVSDKVTVISRKYGSDEAYKWESKGAEGYTISPCQKDDFGTDIIINIKKDTDQDKYDKYLDEYTIREIVKKYSDYIRYPIKMMVQKSKLKEGSEKEYEKYYEDETLNSMVPIWRKNKNELKEQDYIEFYKERRYAFDEPAKYIHMHSEGISEFLALLYIPSNLPFNFYTREYEKGLELYSNGVLIMEKCPDLLLDHFSFVKGLVDSADLSLNISREMLQHDRQLKTIASAIQKKIKNELLDMLKNQREKYEEFFKNFGMQLKYGIYNEFGRYKEDLKDLILYVSSKEKKMITLKEYTERMQEGQKYIYYASGESVDMLEKLPQTELVADKGYEILYLTDDIDEFAIKMLGDYEGKEFRSVSGSDLGIEEEEQKKADKLNDKHKNLLDFMKESLGDKVNGVRISKRLKTHPVCLAVDGELSIEMEKVLNAMPTADKKIKAQRVLEINQSHKIFDKIVALFEGDKETLKKYTIILFNQALLIEGMPIEDPVSYAREICELMVE